MTHNTSFDMSNRQQCLSIKINKPQERSDAHGLYPQNYIHTEPTGNTKYEK